MFENVTFQVHAGQRLGLVGANGSGKTSLFSMVLGQIEAESGELLQNSHDLIAHVSQESPSGPGTALNFVMDGDRELRDTQRSIRAAKDCDAPDQIHALFDKLEQIDGFTAESRAARLLHGLGFSEAEYHKPVREFSGGWRMRLNLAQALMCRSDILLLDEPTNHLDLPAILWLERWLKRYPGILLVVSHDRDFLDSICTRIAHIERQQIHVYNGNYSQFESNRAEQLSQQQAMYKRQQKEIRHIQSYVDRFRYKASKARQAQSRLKMLDRMTRIAPAHVDSPFHFHFGEPEKQPHHLVQLESASAGYEQPVLSDINLVISAGDRLGLLGVNGAGKSTLVKALADGSTLLSGNRLVSKDTKVGYFAQHQLDLLEADQSPMEHLRSRAPGDREAELRNYLGSFGFGGERIFDPVAPFSGGEKARLVLALMIRRKPNLLLLDEPTNHLDLEMRQALSRALMEFGGAIVVISHDRHLLRSVCDQLLVVHDGTVGTFNFNVDDYGEWLSDHRASNSRENAVSSTPVGAERPGKKQQRQIEADRRRKLKPFTDKVRDIESRLEMKRTKLKRLEAELADPAIYSDPGRKHELTGLIRDQAALNADIGTLESEWLDASEALELALSAS